MRMFTSAGASARRAIQRPAARWVGVAAAVLGMMAVVSPVATAAQHRLPRSARPHAVGTCGTPRNSYFDGYLAPFGAGSAEGSYGELATRAAGECRTNTNPGSNFSTAWVMIANGNQGSSGGGYVQSGFYHPYNQCTTYFAQMRPNNASNFQSKFSGCIATDGTVHDYGERYGSDCHCEYAKVNDAVFMTSTFNPYSDWSYPFDPQFFGEAIYLESDMPGSASTPTTFNNLQYEDGPSNAFSLYGAGALSKSNDGAATRSDGEAWYDRTTASPNFEIYTDTAGH